MDRVPVTNTALCQAIPFSHGDEPAPEWVHVLPAGQLDTMDTRGPYMVADAAAVARRSMELAGGKLAIDENHAIDLKAPTGGASPARGWITELEVRDSGIWGKVQWTKAGAAIMADKAYRFLSPVITHLEDHTVTAVLRLALTNRPNLRQIQALNCELTVPLGERRQAALSNAQSMVASRLGVSAEDYRQTLAAEAAPQHCGGALNHAQKAVAMRLSISAEDYQAALAAEADQS